MTTNERACNSHTCCNVKDSTGKLIHIGDKVIGVGGDVIDKHIIGYVHNTSKPGSFDPVCIRVSDNPEEKKIGDFIWSCWCLPSDVRVLETQKAGNQ